MAIADWRLAIAGLLIVDLPIAGWPLTTDGWAIDESARLAFADRGKNCAVFAPPSRFQPKFAWTGSCLWSRMNPQAEALKARAHAFFLRVIKLCGDIPPSAAADSIVEQLLDSAGSTDSNYGAACKGRTRREFIAKVGVAAEEADESLRWLRSLRDAGIVRGTEIDLLIQEANELTSIFVSSHKTASARLAAEQARRRRR